MELFEKRPINGFALGDTSEFVTVVSVGSLEEPINKTQSTEDLSAGYVTVLTIGDEEANDSSEKIEDVLVYRLPGERLGFGLKFEGGTKASEFVKRLFIQSCAADSPASRVRSSWGCLTEGDEVLEIDSIPVKSMTRIDCVRCLKDSNVVIKLLVKHAGVSASAKSTEDLPLVIGAEKKRTPPPPPPIPPRKIPRKFGRENATNIVIPPKGFSDGNQEPPVPPARQTQPENNVNGLKNRHQSPRNSGRLLQPRQSPEVVKRDRRLSDGSIGPPDAEVYVDLFSQESLYCLSESDDTGSSISTVVDRFGSFPTTTTSSFAGSLPSTPTSIQKQMDLSNVLNPFDAEEGEFENDNYLFSKLVSLQACENVESAEEPPIEKIEKCVPLQPPANFQDAPLSYGDEDVRIVEAAIKTAIEINEMPDENAQQIEVENNAMNGIPKALSSKKVDDIVIVKPGKRRPPPPPPRSKHQAIKEKNNNDYNAKNENSENLPRLVDFVPKSAKIEKYETLKRFLENEQRVSAVETQCEHVEGYDVLPNWGDGADFYTFNWSPSSQLATIGEDEEEGLLDIQQQGSPTSSAPIVIVENADEKEEAAKTPRELDVPDGIQDTKKHEQDVAQSLTKSPEPAARTALKPSAPPDVDVMEAPSINSRQPPDGHEFPDYQEAPIISKPIMSEVPAQAKIPARTPSVLRKDQNSTSVRNMIAIFSNNQDNNVPDGEANEALSKKGLSKSVININDTTQSSLKSYNFPTTTKPNTNSHSTNRSSLDISSAQVLPENKMELAYPRLHMRSQSLIDISDKKSNQETDRWNNLVEQRRKGLSKLKGLIIPEHSDPGDETIPSIDLPEIKSTATPVLPPAETKPQPTLQVPNHSRNSSTPSFSLSNWNLESNNTIPKYSPAFKRKTLAVYGTKSETEYTKSVKNQKPTTTSQADDDSRVPVTSSHSDAPKSLESITSPTRSDCSFEYISSSPELKVAAKIQIESRKSEKSREDMGKSEDESDNDSAVSSSQSSYISRNSPPNSPNHLQSHFPSTRLESKYELTGSEQQSTDSLNRRLLKPQSVEAINRKNILASAKCRSGRDLKVGSPLIQRKFEETGGETPAKESEIPKPLPEEEPKPQPPIPPSEEEEEVVKLPISDKPATPPTPPVTKTVEPLTRTAVTKEVLSDAEAKRNLRIREALDVSKPIMPRSISRNNRAASVTDLRKNFEKLTQAPIPKIPTTTASSTSKANSRISLNLNNTPATPPVPIAAKRNSLPNIQQAPVKPKSNADHKVVLDDTLRQYEDSFPKDDLKVIALCPEFMGGSIGITLAGGTDYETKEITVHKVRSGSVAFHDGRLQKGDRILSINGKTMKGITHAESISILKEPVPEVILVACTWKEPPPSSTLTSTSRHNSSFDLTTTSSLPPKVDTANPPVANNNQQEIVVTLVKDAAGLGFSMEGGKDSPQGDVPLVIKKLFTGGTADKCGKLKVGDELVEINGVDVTTMLRIDTWTLMKKLPVGEVILKVRR